MRPEITCSLDSMFRVGLTGGIASGKSAVSSIFESLGALVIDHDMLARRAVEIGSSGLEMVVAEFGQEILNDDGSLNRAALGTVVFSDPKKLAALNGIVHPEVFRLSREHDEAARGSEEIVIHDIPLLVETMKEHSFDAIVVVEAPFETRIVRMVRNRGMAEQDAVARINNQASDLERRAIADYLILNDGDLASLQLKVSRVWLQLNDARNVSGTR